MSVVYMLVIVAILMAGAFLVAFIWSVKDGQYDDTHTPAIRILFDDLPVNSNQEVKKEKKGDRKKEMGKEKKSG
jgi:cbb3-type cytochrome oxidase maturation protein